MPKGYVIYVCDTETTGLNPDENDVIEISMMRLILNDQDEFEREQRTWLLKALNPKTIQDEALRINGHKREDILHLTKVGRETYLAPLDVINDIEMWIMEDGVSAMDRVFAGQNPMFDVNALKALYKRCDNKEFPFAIENGNRVIDTKQIMMLFDLCTGRRRKYYNLSSIVKALSVKKGKAHKADEDTRMTADALLVLINIIRGTVAVQFAACYPDDE